MTGHGSRERSGGGGRFSKIFQKFACVDRDLPRQNLPLLQKILVRANAQHPFLP